MRRKGATSDFLKECLGDALVQLLADHDLDDITVTQIVSRAGVGRATFYRYFTSKEELLEWRCALLCEKWFDMSEIVQRNVGYRELLEHGFHMVLAERALFETLFRSGSSVFQRYLQEHLWYQHEQTDELFYQRVFYSYAIWGICRAWVERGCDLPVHDLVEMIVSSAGGLGNHGQAVHH